MRQPRQSNDFSNFRLTIQQTFRFLNLVLSLCLVPLLVIFPARLVIDGASAFFRALRPFAEKKLSAALIIAMAKLRNFIRFEGAI